MYDTVADVEFIAGSPNRAAVLQTLADRPRDRRDLVDDVGVSRVTVGRILADLVARAWVTSDGGVYRATPVGEVVATELSSLAETMETMRMLSAVTERFPPDLDVDLRRFADARVTLPTEADWVAPVRRMAELGRGAARLRVAVSGVAPDVVEAIGDAAVAGADVTLVATASALDVVDGCPRMRGWLADAIAAGAAVHLHPGFSYLLGECDGTAVVGVTDELGVLCGLVESDDPAVREWVTATVDRCIGEAEPLINERSHRERSSDGEITSESSVR